VATQSIIAAVLEKYDSGLSAAHFPSAAKPPVYFDEAPAVDAAGAQLDAEGGFVVLRDEGQDVQSLGFERQTLEVAAFVLEVYYPSLANVDAAVLAIKRNGGTAAQAQGFDFGTLVDLTSPRGTFEIVRTKEQRSKAGVGKTGKRVHVCKLSYRVVVQEAA
jgi:hypothetical protein